MTTHRLTSQQVETLRLGLLAFLDRCEDVVMPEQLRRWRPVLLQPAVFAERMRNPETQALAVALFDAIAKPGDG
jgi:hypothetical protein